MSELVLHFARRPQLDIALCIIIIIKINCICHSVKSKSLRHNSAIASISVMHSCIINPLIIASGTELLAKFYTHHFLLVFTFVICLYC